MASLHIKNTGKCYDDVRAIANVSLEVADGEFLVLVGPSGCGKSTLLRMIAGLEELTEGSIHLGERDVSHVDPRFRDVAMVFQNYALYPHMSVFENMAFSLEQRKTPRDEIQRIVMETARTLDLQELIERKPGALSGGQRQRVAMGRAIVRNPTIYLMDEPLSNLDAKLRVQMRAELKLLRARLGVTTVYVTHDQIEAMTLGDRVAVLAPVDGNEQSNLQQVDHPQALYHEPYNMFVASFIGSPAMNFFHADLERQGENLSLCIADTALRCELGAASTPVFPALQAYAGQRIIIGIRPEHLNLESLGDDALCIDTEILVTEHAGPDAFLHFDLPTPDVRVDSVRALDKSNDTGHSASRFTARVASEKLGADSASRRLSVAPRQIHFFDPASTVRLRAD